MSKVIEECSIRIKRAMALRNITATELSEKTGISKGSISQYMSGYVKPKQDRIFLIANALSVDPVWLIGYDVPMEKDEKLFDLITESMEGLSERQLTLLLAFIKSMKGEEQ